jgi:hypothetical protein
MLAGSLISLESEAGTMGDNCIARGERGPPSARESY